MILGIGIDLVTVSRFSGMIDRHGDRLLNRLFTPNERAYCDRYTAPAQHYAARFAGKEAVLKALSVPRGLTWHELEVISTQTRAPICRLSGEAQHVAQQRGITSIWITLTHEVDTAAAFVVTEGDPTPKSAASSRPDGHQR